MELITRKEMFLQAAVDGSPLDEPAVTRVERFLAKIAGTDVDIPTPVTQEEMYLASIAGEEVELPEPVTRIDRFLAKVAGMDVETPEPVTRIEMILEEWGGFASEYKEVSALQFGSNCYYLVEGFNLLGSDTVRISFEIAKACNVFGCYTTSSATDNFSLYASTASNAKYLRHGSGVYKSYFANPGSLNKRFDVVISPTGSSGMPTGQDDSWTAEEFECSADLCVGYTSPSGTSAKLDGIIYGHFVVDGRLDLVPCIRKADNEVGYYDKVGKVFYEPVGTTPTPIE